MLWGNMAVLLEMEGGVLEGFRLIEVERRRKLGEWEET